MRPLFSYYGSKFRVAEWILSHFPPHVRYVETFFGSGAILFAKTPIGVETVCDTDGRVVNFWRSLRANAETVARQILLTPFARAEFEGAKPRSPNAIEDARRVYCLLRQSWERSTKAKTWGKSTRSRTKSAPNVLVQYESALALAARLSRVQIEDRDARYALATYDSRDTMFYLDPPYVTSTRVQKSQYQDEWTDEDHRKFLRSLRSVRGFIVLSGYRNDIYRDELEAKGWKRRDRTTKSCKHTSVIESIWLSPRTAKALAR